MLPFFIFWTLTIIPTRCVWGRRLAYSHKYLAPFLLLGVWLFSFAGFCFPSHRQQNFRLVPGSWRFSPSPSLLCTSNGTEHICPSCMWISPVLLFFPHENRTMRLKIIRINTFVGAKSLFLQNSEYEPETAEMCLRVKVSLSRIGPNMWLKWLSQRLISSWLGVSKDPIFVPDFLAATCIQETKFSPVGMNESDVCKPMSHPWRRWGNVPSLLSFLFPLAGVSVWQELE